MKTKVATEKRISPTCDKLHRKLPSKLVKTRSVFCFDLKFSPCLGTISSFCKDFATRAITSSKEVLTGKPHISF